MSCQLEWLAVLSHVSEGARANNCHGPGLALTRHCLPYTGWEIRSVGRFAPWTPLPRRTFSPLPTACILYETRRYCYIASILMTAMQTRYTHTHTRLTALFPGLPVLVLSQRTLPCTGVDVFRTGVGLSACECVRVFHLLIYRFALPRVFSIFSTEPRDWLGRTSPK